MQERLPDIPTIQFTIFLPEMCFFFLTFQNEEITFS